MVKILSTKIQKRHEEQFRRYVENIIRCLNSGRYTLANNTFGNFCGLYEDLIGELWEAENDK